MQGHGQVGVLSSACVLRSVPVLSLDRASVGLTTRLQLLNGGSEVPSTAAQQAQQAAGEGVCGGGAAGSCSVRPQPQLASTLENQPSEFGNEFLEEQPSSGSLESLPEDFRLLAAIAGSPGPHGSLQTSGGGGGGSGAPSPHGPHLRRRAGSTASLAGSVGSEGSASDCNIVVHNLAAYLSAREIGEFFMQ